ncbi:hypothetical protein OC844_004169 [Tilletia horrida]|nr:hypothetical protein OC844_004169 [Tilletia horrida]
MNDVQNALTSDEREEARQQFGEDFENLHDEGPGGDEDVAALDEPGNEEEEGEEAGGAGEEVEQGRRLRHKLQGFIALWTAH